MDFTSPGQDLQPLYASNALPDSLRRPGLETLAPGGREGRWAARLGGETVACTLAGACVTQCCWRRSVARVVVVWQRMRVDGEGSQRETRDV